MRRKLRNYGGNYTRKSCRKIAKKRRIVLIFGTVAWAGKAFVFSRERFFFRYSLSSKIMSRDYSIAHVRFHRPRASVLANLIDAPGDDKARGFRRGPQQARGSPNKNSRRPALRSVIPLTAAVKVKMRWRRKGIERKETATGRRQHFLQRGAAATRLPHSARASGWKCVHLDQGVAGGVVFAPDNRRAAAGRFRQDDRRL